VVRITSQLSIKGVLSCGDGGSAKHPIRGFFGGLRCEGDIHPIRAIEFDVAVHGFNFRGFVKEFFGVHTIRMPGTKTSSSRMALSYTATMTRHVSSSHFITRKDIL
jgi:hypothetical protein